MRNSAKHEFWVGLFVLLGLLSIVFISLQVAGMSLLQQKPTYQLKAQFENIGSLKPRSSVKIGGVTVGMVQDIFLDPQNYQPTVTIALDKNIQITDNGSISIKTSGLLGEQYLSLNPGVVIDEETEILKDGDMILNSQSALVIEDLIGKFLYGQNK